MYLALSKFQKQIEEYAKEKQHNWRIASRNETEKYIKEAIKERQKAIDYFNRLIKEQQKRKQQQKVGE